MDYSPLISTVYGIIQARILEWVATPFSRGSSQPRDQTQVSCIRAQRFTEKAAIADDCDFLVYWYGKNSPFLIYFLPVL